MTRHPTRPQGEAAHGLDDLEELGDDAIIAQQTIAHAPRPRVNVAEESRSVVISDHPPRHDTQPPRNSLPRATAEPTLIIRDRRALDEMRQKIIERQIRQKSKSGRSIYVWGALGLAAFVLGGVVAFLATDSHSEGEAVTTTSPPARPGETRPVAPQPAAKSESASGSATSAGARVAGDSSPTPAVRLDDLPVEHRKH